ncbi:hypothetical protein RIR_jg30283.t1 [Rhizophagus irregularis DAOM 181602=DAOM 197198]|nr:hypothetical protein RIR_jg30283.t1 [Rhizophagus irregularis DAOM 181602=DAOM 197198]
MNDLLKVHLSNFAAKKKSFKFHSRKIINNPSQFYQNIGIDLKECIHFFLKYRLSHIYDKIQSKHDTFHGKLHKRKCYKLHRVMLRIHKKFRCLINDCHHKLAKWGHTSDSANIFYIRFVSIHGVK